MSEHTSRETIEVEGEHLVKKIEEIIAEGNVRKIAITHGGHIIAEFPVTIGVVGLVLAPMLAAIGAIVAVATDCKIEVERVAKKE